MLAAAWSEWDTRRRFGRIEEMLQYIQQKLSQLNVNNAAADDAGMHLLELVLREAQLQHSEKKRKRLANVLVASWVSAEPPKATFDESILFVRATAVFTDSHIAVLDAIHQAGPNASMSFSEIGAMVSETSNLDDTSLIVLNDLCSVFGFVKRAWDLNRPDRKQGLFSTANLGPEGIARKCFHAITPRGSRYVNHVIRGM